MDPSNNYANIKDDEFLMEALQNLVRDVESGSNEDLLTDIERFAPGWIIHKATSYSRELNAPPFIFHRKWEMMCKKIETDLKKEQEELLLQHPDVNMTHIRIVPQEILIVRHSPVLYNENETVLRWIVEELHKRGYQVRNINEFTVCKATGKVIFSKDFTRIYLHRKFDGYAKEYRGVRSQ
jgi:hypothetical protein